MSEIKQHLGLLQGLKDAGQREAYREQAILFIDAHLDDLIELAGGVELEDFAKEALDRVRVSKSDPSCMGAFLRAKP